MTGRRLKIIIIEDEESIRETMKWHFEDLGHEVLAASVPNFCRELNPQECTATKRCGDLLFIDQNLPGVTGLEFVRWLFHRGCQLSPGHIWIMTGDLTAAVQAEAALLGCNAVAKPLSLGEAEKLVLQVERGEAVGEGG